MGRVILSMYVSADGFVSGPNGELDLLPQTPETSQYAVDLLSTADAILLGGRAYRMFESYWPTAATNPGTIPTDLPLAAQINALPKYVFGPGLNGTNWNATAAGDDISAEVTELKRRHKGDLVLFGGARTAQAFMQNGLIDEYHLLVCPIVFGDGKPLFSSPGDQMNLTLLRADALRPSGIAALYYQPGDPGR
jgi:dihydrofolate reductase